MPFFVLCYAMMASFELILSGPICVDCKSNLATDSAGIDFQNNRVVFFLVLRVAGTTQTPCLTLFFS